MSRFIRPLLDRKNSPAKRSNQRPRLQLEPLENRLTPCLGCNNLTLTNVLDVTFAPIALAATDAGPQDVMLELDGMVRLASGGAEQAAGFTIEEVASLKLPPGQGETSIKIDFTKLVDQTLAGATESAEIKGDAVVRLKLDGAAEVASIRLDDAVSLKLQGAAAEGDVTLHVDVKTGEKFSPFLPDVSFDEASGLTTNQEGLAPSSGAGAGKGKFADGWRCAVMGDAFSINYTKRADLTVDDAPVLADVEKWDITPAAPAVGTTRPSSLMLDGMESLSLNFTPASEATENMEYSNQWVSAGGLTSYKYDHALTLMDGPTAMATQEAHLQLEGESSDAKYADDITLAPDDPTDLASNTQDIEAVGSGITLTVNDTVDLLVAGLELPSHTHQTETGDVVSIHIDSLLSPPGPGPGPGG